MRSIAVLLCFLVASPSAFGGAIQKRSSDGTTDFNSLIDQLVDLINNAADLQNIALADLDLTANLLLVSVSIKLDAGVINGANNVSRLVDVEVTTTDEGATRLGVQLGLALQVTTGLSVSAPPLINNVGGSVVADLDLVELDLVLEVGGSSLLVVSADLSSNVAIDVEVTTDIPLVDNLLSLVASTISNVLKDSVLSTVLDTIQSVLQQVLGLLPL